jgi:hypothetical protein
MYFLSSKNFSSMICSSLYNVGVLKYWLAGGGGWGVTRALAMSRHCVLCSPAVVVT